MQKRWHIVYTKPKCEKKVSAILSKKKIENFLPVTYKQVNSIRKSKLINEPLFDSYIFARVTEAEITRIRSIDGVVNLLYWKGKPAIVHEDEIAAIKEFTNDYQDIRLEKTLINPNEEVRVMDAPKYSIEGNLLTIKNTSIKVNLPSIGFAIIVKIDSENAITREVSFGDKRLFLQS